MIVILLDVSFHSCDDALNLTHYQLHKKINGSTHLNRSALFVVHWRDNQLFTCECEQGFCIFRCPHVWCWARKQKDTLFYGLTERILSLWQGRFIVSHTVTLIFTLLLYRLVAVRNFYCEWLVSLRFLGLCSGDTLCCWECHTDGASGKSTCSNVIDNLIFISVTELGQVHGDIRKKIKAMLFVIQAIQCLGGNGYINEYPIGRLLRDAKLYEIGAGTSEIRRIVIGRAFNRMYKQER